MFLEAFAAVNVMLRTVTGQRSWS